MEASNPSGRGSSISKGPDSTLANKTSPSPCSFQTCLQIAVALATSGILDARYTKKTGRPSTLIDLGSFRTSASCSACRR